MKKLFTLIELIVVIAVLGILVAIIIPNISSFQEEANTTAIKSNVRNLQTSVDMFSLDNFNGYPTVQEPTETIPQPIDFDKITPEYNRDLPETEGVKYWVDFKGKVWASTIDSPTGVEYNLSTLKWEKVEDAAYYNVFKLTNNNTVSKADKKNLIFLKKVEKSVNDEITVSVPEIEGDDKYLVSAIDDNGFESAPAGANYTGIDILKEGPVTFSSKDFNYTGTYTTFEVPSTGIYKLETWGASGGNTTWEIQGVHAYGGKGGYAYGEKYLNKGDILYIYVGGKGQNYNEGSSRGVGAKGGFNGGGNSGNDTVDAAGVGGGGGGATDIRLDGQELSNRIIVAGGAGGAGGAAGGGMGKGGDGGGLNGQNGQTQSISAGGNGGTQTTGYALGLGGNSASGHDTGGAGGGGYYGGFAGETGAGGEGSGGGGGGSSYVNGLSNSNTVAGQRIGHGTAKITFLGH